MQELSYVPYAISDYDIDREIDTREFARLQQILETTEVAAPTLHRAPPASVDLSNYLHYIRYQTGGGCWNYSLNAVWDIMNEMACPYSPNLSMCLPLWVHRNREKWQTANGLFLPDGRFIKKDYEKMIGGRLEIKLIMVRVLVLPLLIFSGGIWSKKDFFRKIRINGCPEDLSGWLPRKWMNLPIIPLLSWKNLEPA